MALVKACVGAFFCFFGGAVGCREGRGVGSGGRNKNNPLQLEPTASTTEPAVASPERAAAVIFFLLLLPPSPTPPLEPPLQSGGFL